MISRTAIIYKGNVREDNTWCFIITLIKKTQEQQIISQYRTVKTAKEQHIISHYHSDRTTKGKQWMYHYPPQSRLKRNNIRCLIYHPSQENNGASFSPHSRQQWTLYAVSLSPQPGQRRDNKHFVVITQSRQRRDNKHCIIITQSGQQRDNKWCSIITPVKTTRNNKCCLIITSQDKNEKINDGALSQHTKQRWDNRWWLINISFKATKGQQIMVYHHGSQVNDRVTNYVSLLPFSRRGEQNLSYCPFKTTNE